MATVVPESSDFSREEFTSSSVAVDFFLDTLAAAYPAEDDLRTAEVSLRRFLAEHASL